MLKTSLWIHEFAQSFKSPNLFRYLPVWKPSYNSDCPCCPPLYPLQLSSNTFLTTADHFFSQYHNTKMSFPCSDGQFRAYYSVCKARGEFFPPKMHHLTFSTLNFTCHFQSHHRVSRGLCNQFSTMHAVTFDIFSF